MSDAESDRHWEASREPGAAPLLLTHGWPSTFLEYLDIFPLLTNPPPSSDFPGEGFTVVAPSLPGFGFSGPPPADGLTAGAVAELWNQLMVEVLGHPRYFAHGSDLGAGVTAWLARAHPESVVATHLATPGLGPPPKPWTAAEDRYFEAVRAWSAAEGAYAEVHSTKPMTIAAALLDSPIGLAAWMGEKWTAWSSTTPDGAPSVSREHLLSTLTLYWCTTTVGYSLLPYWAYRHAADAALPADNPAPTPTAIDLFGGESVRFPKPPVELARRYFNVVSWAEHDVGGHFPAVAEPELLVHRLQECFRPYRNRARTQA